MKSRKLVKPNEDEPLRQHVVSIRLSDDELERLNGRVRASGLTASDIIRYALEAYDER